MTDDELLVYKNNIACTIRERLNSVDARTPVTEAVSLLLKRIVSGYNCLLCLRQCNPRFPEYNFAFDGAIILRTVYDAMLQALYILSDRAEYEGLAQLYLDCYWVEKREAARLFKRNPTTFAKEVMKSPNRTDAESNSEKEFERVKDKFLTNGNGLRRHWYPQENLRDLSKDIELESEYELLQKELSGTIHSSPFSLKHDPVFRDIFLLELSWRFLIRVLGKFAEYKNVPLNTEETKYFKGACNNIFEVNMGYG